MYVDEKLSRQIINRLPYLDSFLFVDEISFVDENTIVGHYTFSRQAFFYNAHFIHKAVTPGVILMEMMGQIGMVSHLIYLNKLHINDVIFHPVLSHIECAFLKMVEVDDKLTVISEKVYFRKSVLKSKVVLKNSKGEECAHVSGQLQLVYNS